MESQRKIKVFMFPWLAHGHISPFLELAKTLISKRNFEIYLCSTPVNLACTRRRLTEKSIHLVELHVPELPGLPRKYHTTKSLPPHLMPTLKKAFDASLSKFSKLLTDVDPDLLIYDTIQPWAPVVAALHNIPAVAFVSTSATMTSFMIHRFRNGPGMDFRFPPEIYLHEHENSNFNHLLQSPENYYKGKGRFFECLEKSCEMILIKSSREIEGKYIDHLSDLAGKAIVPVGPLVQAPVDDNQRYSSIIEWLDAKEPGSTVFVSFGSEYFLTKEEMKEMAHGLEFSGVNFIWVVRFPEGEEVGVDESLPLGFTKRVEGRGLVVPGWAPQVKILEHPNVGGFVSHCGWSSLMEGISYGVPIIAMPMHLDQPVNARLVKEIGVGVEVMRDERGLLVRQEIARVIKEVVRGKKIEIAKKEKELVESMRVKEEEVTDRVVDGLLQLCKSWKKPPLKNGTHQNGIHLKRNGIKLKGITS